MANKVFAKKKEPRVKLVEKDFKERINQLYKELYADKNKSISAMAKDANISPAAMNYYLSGERMPDLEGLRRICGAFNCSADWLLGLTDVRSSSEDVKTAVQHLGINERFIETIARQDNSIRQFLYILVETPGFMDVFLPKYIDYKIVEGELVRRVAENTHQNDENKIKENGDVVLSRKEAVEYYANRVGYTLAAVLVESSYKVCNILENHNNTL